MNPSINRIRASDGSGNASLATVQSTRAPLASTINVDTVASIPDEFVGSMGTPHTFTDPITSETITVISEATCVDFKGHVDGADLEIDEISPGYTDLGSEIGDIIIIRPTTAYADNVADVLDVSHDDDGTIKKAAVVEALDTYGVLGAVRKYTSSDTWSKPAGLKFVEVEVVGGGGGGGGGATAAAGNCSPGGGGGGGGYSYKKIAAASLGATEAVTIGAAGAGGASGANNGTAGGASSFGTHAVGNGGSAGTGAGASTTYVPPGGALGGTATGGDINIPGGASGGGVASPTDGRCVSQFGGHSGNGFGSGAPSVRVTTGNSTGGTAATGFGGGGSGGSVGASASQVAGGAGTAGIVIVREYY